MQMNNLNYINALTCTNFSKKNEEALFLKPLSWQNAPDNLQEKMMAVFDQYLSDIQNIASLTAETQHVSKNPSNRPLSQIDKLPYSFRVTADGDIWVLSENKVNKKGLKEVYSPTKGEYGIKKSLGRTEMKGNVLASTLNSSKIIKVEDIARISKIDTFEDKKVQKYSLITPRMTGSIKQKLKQILKAVDSSNQAKQFLEIYQNYLKAWIQLVREAGTFHPDLHPGNALFRCKDDNELEIVFIDFDDLEQEHCLPKEALANLNEYYLTKSCHKRTLKINMRSFLDYLRSVLNNSNIEKKEKKIIEYYLYCWISCLYSDRDVESLSYEEACTLHEQKVKRFLLRGDVELDQIFDVSLGLFLNRLNRLVEKKWN